jgi:hypothetical protein
MLTAESVYNIAKALSKEELRNLHARISKDLIPVKTSKTLNKKPNRISKSEIQNMLLTTVFNVKLREN